MTTQGTPGASARKSEIEAALLLRGFAMEHSLAVLEGDAGHAVIELATGEVVDSFDDEVRALAIEWSLLEGAVEDL